MTSNPEGILTAPLDDLPAIVGRTFGPSSWREITQAEVTGFADLSGDHNPVHLDPTFAAGTPFGTTIVHGYFTLSLVVPLMAEVFEVTGIGVGINYGLDRLRFPAPVPVGSRVRAHATLVDVADVPAGHQATFGWTIEIEGTPRPGCVAETVVLLLG